MTLWKYPRLVSVFLALSCGFTTNALQASTRIVMRGHTDTRYLNVKDHITPLAQFYLHERLSECSSVRILSEWRGRALFSVLTSAVQDVPEDKILSSFCAFTPVDAIIRILYVDDQLQIKVHLPGEIRVLTYKEIGAGSRRATVLRAAADLAYLFSLSPTEKGILIESRLPSEEIFHGCYYSRAIGSPYPQNPAKPRLQLLGPLFWKNRNSVPLSARILEEAHYLVAAKKRTQDYAKTGLRLASLAMPIVLGTIMFSGILGPKLAERALRTADGEKPDAH